MITSMARNPCRVMKQLGMNCRNCARQNPDLNIVKRANSRSKEALGLAPGC
jgi:hypothetical protein